MVTNKSELVLTYHNFLPSIECTVLLHIKLRDVSKVANSASEVQYHPPPPNPHNPCKCAAIFPYIFHHHKQVAHDVKSLCGDRKPKWRS